MVKEVQFDKKKLGILGSYLINKTHVCWIKRETLNWLLNGSIDWKGVSELGVAGHLSFTVTAIDKLVFFISNNIVKNDSQVHLLPEFIKSKFIYSLKKPASELTIQKLVIIADCWRLISEDFDTHDLTIEQLKILSISLDYLGEHAKRQELQLRCPRLLTKPKWPAIRGVHDSDPSHLSHVLQEFIKIESADFELISEIEKRTKITNERSFFFILKLVCYPIIGILQILALLVARRNTVEKVDRWMNEHANSESHWDYSSRVLANYWYKLPKSIASASRLFLKSISDNNPFITLRALDWWLFTSPHTRGLRYNLAIYKLLIPIAKRYAPYLLADIQMHYGILNFYRGNFTESLSIQASVERQLSHGNHPFNREVNLQNALRTSVSTRAPRFTNIIYRLITKNDEFNRGLHPYRTKLAMAAQRVREDGKSTHIESVKQLESLFQTLPPMISATLYSQLMITYIEAGEYSLIKAGMKNWIKSLDAAGAKNPFKYILKSIEEVTLRDTKGSKQNYFSIINSKKSGWNYLSDRKNRVCSEDEFPISYKKMIALNFGDRCYSNDSQFTSIDHSSRLGRCKNLSDLFTEMQNIIYSSLPEFRFFAEADGFKISSEVSAPHEIETLRAVYQTLEQHELITLEKIGTPQWTYIYKETVGYKKFKIWLGAPTIYKNGGGNRFLLAHGLANWFCQVINTILSVELENEYKRKETERNHERKISQLITQIAHDIRSPLAALDILTNELGSDSSNEEKQLVQAAIRRIKEISNDLLKHQKANSTAFSINEDVIMYYGINEVSERISEVLVEKKIQTTNSNVEVQYKRADESDSALIFCNLIELQRILSNLINNSLESIKENGKIFIRTEIIKSFLSISIEDNGHGIPDDIMPKLFQRGESYGKKDGTGLGLNHAQTCLNSWGGSIKLESQQNVGTKVTIYAPLSG